MQPSVAENVISFVEPETKLDACFGPELSLPLSVLEQSSDEESQVVGLVTADQIRDSLMIALTGNRIFSHIKIPTMTNHGSDRSNDE